MSSKQVVKRFQYWRLTGRGEIAGMLPIPDGRDPATHTEITYENDRIVTVREWTVGQERPLERKPTFEGRRLLRSQYFDPSREKRGTNCYEYDPRGLLKRRYELDEHEKLRFEIHVSCDPSGFFLEEKLFDHRKRLRARHVYENDAQGRVLIDRVFGGKEGDKLEGSHHFTYDPRGNITQRAWYDAGGKEQRAFLYRYDANDRRVGITIVEQGEKKMSLAKSYDERGRLLSTEVQDGFGHTMTKELPGDAGEMLRQSLADVPEAERTEAEQDLLLGKRKLGEILGISAKQAKAMATVAYAHLEQGRFAQARALFEALATLDPDDVYALAGVGASALSQELPETAVTWYDRALLRDPNHTPSLVGRAEAWLRLGQVDKALMGFKEAFERAPKKDEPHIRRAQGIVAALAKSAGG